YDLPPPLPLIPADAGIQCFGSKDRRRKRGRPRIQRRLARLLLGPGVRRDERIKIMPDLQALDIASIDFAKGNGLIPAAVQDADTLQVLTLAYMDAAALRETLDSGQATF